MLMFMTSRMLTTSARTLQTKKTKTTTMSIVASPISFFCSRVSRARSEFARRTCVTARYYHWVGGEDDGRGVYGAVYGHSVWVGPVDWVVTGIGAGGVGGDFVGFGGDECAVAGAEEDFGADDDEYIDECGLGCGAGGGGWAFDFFPIEFAELRLIAGACGDGAASIAGGLVVFVWVVRGGWGGDFRGTFRVILCGVANRGNDLVSGGVEMI